MRALVFPGQGSQKLGMSIDFAEKYDVAKLVFEEASNALGYDIFSQIKNDEKAELNQTQYTQPALFVASAAILEVIKQETGKKITDICDFVAGHSLGEYTALYAANVLTLSDSVSLLKTRGEAMVEAGKENSGSMAAVLGLTFAQVEELVAKASDDSTKLYIANDNSDGQVVVAGHAEAVKRAESIAADMGARKYVPLAVSVASHSPLMSKAADIMEVALDKYNFAKPSVPIVFNVTAKEEADVSKFKSLLIKQLTQPVRFKDSIQYLVAKGCNEFIEIGSSKVLSGLIKRIDKSSSIKNIENVEQFNKDINLF